MIGPGWMCCVGLCDSEAGRAGLVWKTRKSLISSPHPAFFLQKKKIESRLMMVLDSGAGVGWHSEHWDEVAERPNWTEPDELNFLSISTRLVDNHCHWFIFCNIASYSISSSNPISIIHTQTRRWPFFSFLKPIRHEVRQLVNCR